MYDTASSDDSVSSTEDSSDYSDDEDVFTSTTVAGSRRTNAQATRSFARRTRSTRGNDRRLSIVRSLRVLTTDGTDGTDGTPQASTSIRGGRRVHTWRRATRRNNTTSKMPRATISLETSDRMMLDDMFEGVRVKLSATSSPVRRGANLARLGKNLITSGSFGRESSNSVIQQQQLVGERLNLADFRKGLEDKLAKVETQVFDKLARWQEEGEDDPVAQMLEHLTELDNSLEGAIHKLDERTRSMRQFKKDTNSVYQNLTNFGRSERLLNAANMGNLQKRRR
jgi:hypothetical protein